MHRLSSARLPQTPNPGAVIRATRTAWGYTQEQVGSRCNLSRSQVSRYETGASLPDVPTLRRFAAVLQIPPHLLGLADTGRDSAPLTVHQRLVRPSVIVGSGGDEDGESMQRREVLALGGAVVAGAAGSPVSSLTDQLMRVLTTPGARGISRSTAQLRGAYQRASSAFEACRYAEAADQLATLAEDARATQITSAGPARDHASSVLVLVYTLCAELSIKAADDSMAWVIADRGLALAEALGDPALLGVAARQAAIGMRRAKHYEGGLQLLGDTAAKLDADASGRVDTRLMSALGGLHTATAYNQAQRGNGPAAKEAIACAYDLARRASRQVQPGLTSFSETVVIEYEISVCNALGDPAGALKAAGRVRPDNLPTRERYGHYALSVARAWHQQGRLDRALQALVSVEKYVPEDVRRPSVQALAVTLVSASHPPTGAMAFATRIGALAR